MMMSDNLDQIEPLTTLDRCDRCGSQAYVRTGHPSGPLLWCGHHFAHAEVGIRSVSTFVHDEREVLRAAESKAAVT